MMTEKTDLVMWTHNRAWCIGQVLKRINDVVPHEHVNNRFIVDEHSTDGTVQIAESLGWKVYESEDWNKPLSPTEHLERSKRQAIILFRLLTLLFLKVTFCSRVVGGKSLAIWMIRKSPLLRA
jgi:glycosyltransferase involved in cell wall biosynthesis